MTALTVCVPSIPARASLLSRLLWSLQMQPLDGVEVLVSDDGRRPMGDKLNEMFAAAAGEYVVAVDDDDYLTADYMARVVPLLVEGADFTGYQVLWLEDGRFAGRVSHRLGGDTSWSTLQRGVSPKCPVRTEVARRHRFGNEYTADRVWSAEVERACEFGIYLPAPLYVYDHWSSHMLGTSPDDPRFGRPQRDVGFWPYDPEGVTWIG